MKKFLLIGALAFAFASPVAAQTAPANPHQGHDMSQMQGHSGHAQHGQTQGSGQHGQHQGHNMQGDCCADRNGNGRMDCCENMPADRNCCEQHQGHQAQAQPQPSPNR